MQLHSLKVSVVTYLPFFFLSIPNVVGATLSIWNTDEDYSQNCFSKVSPVEEGGVEFLRVTPNKWKDGRLILDCMMGNRPNLGDFEALTFQTRVTGPLLDDGSCQPRLQMRGGPHPRPLSNIVVLEGIYVDNGELDGLDWRTVVIPMSALRNTDWPDLDRVMDIRFLKCSGFSGYEYNVRSIEATNDPPVIGNSDDALPPDENSTPSQSPASSSRPDINMYSSLSDGYSLESNDKSCLFGKAIQTSATSSGANMDFIRIATNKWHSGGLSFGCLETNTAGACTHSCFDNGVRPDFSSREALTFLAKVANSNDSDSDCRPRLRIYGNGSPAKQSNTIVLEGNFVDEGYLTADDWRNVRNINKFCKIHSVERIFLTLISNTCVYPFDKGRDSNSRPAKLLGLKVWC